MKPQPNRRTHPQWKAIIMPTTEENKQRILRDAVLTQQRIRAELDAQKAEQTHEAQQQEQAA